jgi:hypothetical protein
VEAAHVEDGTAAGVLRWRDVAATGAIEGWQEVVRLRVRNVLHVRVYCGRMVESAAGKRAGGAGGSTVRPRRRAFASDATECLRAECVHTFCTSEAGLVTDPQAAVLLPWEVRQKVVFGIDIVAEGARAEESVHEAAVWELTENLGRLYLAKLLQDQGNYVWLRRKKV